MEETTIPRNEIIQVADIVAREKSIDREIVFFAMEEAIQKAGKSRYERAGLLATKIARNVWKISKISQGNSFYRN